MRTSIETYVSDSRIRSVEQPVKRLFDCSPGELVRFIHPYNNSYVGVVVGNTTERVTVLWSMNDVVYLDLSNVRYNVTFSEGIDVVHVASKDVYHVHKIGSR